MMVRRWYGFHFVDPGSLSMLFKEDGSFTTQNRMNMVTGPTVIGSMISPIKKKFLSH